MADCVATVLWRKLDGPGHDTCRLYASPRGWRLAGTAVFLEARRICQLAYEVTTDAAWRTRRARVSGQVGRRAVDLRIAAAGAGRWRVGGEAIAAVNGCIDLDLAFTPATNLIALRRLALRVGQRAEAPAAWLRFPDLRLVALPQAYQRIARDRYRYASPTVGYAGVLEVLPSGMVSRYPGLFELLAATR